MSIAGGPLLSRALALALLVGVVGLLATTVAEPLFGLSRDYGERIERAERLSAAFEQRSHDQAALRRRIAALGADSAARRGFFKSDNPTLAGVELQSRLRSLVDAAGAQLLTTQTLAGEGREPFPRVAVRAQLLADTVQMRQIFHAIESGTPNLFVDNLAIRAPAAGHRVEDRTRGDMLAITCDIYGYLWQGAAP